MATIATFKNMNRFNPDRVYKAVRFADFTELIVPLMTELARRADPDATVLAARHRDKPCAVVLWENGLDLDTLVVEPDHWLVSGSTDAGSATIFVMTDEAVKSELTEVTGDQADKDSITINVSPGPGTSGAYLSTSIHLTNDHGISSPAKTAERRAFEHYEAHLTAQFRDGKGHYHRPEARP